MLLLSPHPSPPQQHIPIPPPYSRMNAASSEEMHLWFGYLAGEEARGVGPLDRGGPVLRPSRVVVRLRMLDSFGDEGRDGCHVGGGTEVD